MNLHLDERGPEDFAFYIDGDLQFDTRDEALYHEYLALPALCLALRRFPDAPLRVLICGGGDGLALRECLRFPNVARIDLVDYSAEVVAWGRERFAGLNARAFDDPRATIHIADAWAFLNAQKQQKADEASAGYHVILCDFTVPRRDEDTRVFSREWYALLRQALAPNGLIALNAVSPQTAPEAFWCLRQTVRAARLSAQPYRVCIPSFRAQGYGAWAFMLAGERLKHGDLRDLECPVVTRQADLTRLWNAAQFSAEERRAARHLPPHTLDAPCLLPLLLNPGLPRAVPTAQNDARAPEPSAQDTTTEASVPYNLDNLLAAIPISHPYHTRTMIEALAEQVAGTVRRLDIQQLVSALMRRASRLPLALQTELARLQTFLQSRLPGLDWLGGWGRKLFVILVILMTVANSIAPDNAFGKGTGSFGHASMSRGYGGSFGGGRGGYSSGAGHTSSGSFGGGRPGYSGGNGSSGSGSRGSFSGKPGYGSSFGSGGRASGGFRGPAPSIRSAGFRRGYGREHLTDMEGGVYAPRTFTYSHYYYNPYNHGGGYAQSAGGVNAQSHEAHQALFVADDDMIVLDNGDIVITLSDEAYLLVSGAYVTLMSSKTPTPLYPLYPDPALFDNIIKQLQAQQEQVGSAIHARQEWLAWVGWTSAFMGNTADDKLELRNLEDLAQRLEAALSQIKPPPENAVPSAPPDTPLPPPPTPETAGQRSSAPPLQTGTVELFVDAIVMANGDIALRGADNVWARSDGRQITPTGKSASACSPEMRAALKSVLLKLQKEFAGDLDSLNNDLNQLKQDRASLDKDLTEYNQIYAANSSSYEVDYGTDEIPVSDAIARTQADIASNSLETTQTQMERDKQSQDLERVQQAIQQFGQ